MADKEEEKKEEEKDAPSAKGKSSDDLGLGDDLMELFSDESDETDVELALLVSTLEDVPMAQLLDQVHDIRDIIAQRRAA